MAFPLPRLGFDNNEVHVCFRYCILCSIYLVCLFSPAHMNLAQASMEQKSPVYARACLTLISSVYIPSCWSRIIRMYHSLLSPSSQ